MGNLRFDKELSALEGRILCAPDLRTSNVSLDDERAHGVGGPANDDVGQDLADYNAFPPKNKSGATLPLSRQCVGRKTKHFGARGAEHLLVGHTSSGMGSP